jgi:hypothetical protein
MNSVVCSREPSGRSSRITYMYEKQRLKKLITLLVFTFLLDQAILTT